MAADDLNGGSRIAAAETGPPPISDDDLKDLARLQQHAADLFPYTLKLRAPIQAHGEMVDSLTIELPTGSDLVHSGGDPWVNGAASPPDLKRLVTLLARLSHVPESSIRQLTVPDLKTLEGALQPLFSPSAEMLRGLFLTSRGSGATSGR